MNTEKLIALVTILSVLSIATERLVEIIKGYWPSLNSQVGVSDPSKTDETAMPADPDPIAEARRKSKVNILSIGCGIITAFLASSLLSGIFKDLLAGDTCSIFNPWVTQVENTPCGLSYSTRVFLVLGLGLLASGGSALWNSILEYLLKIKDLKKIEVKRSDAMRKIDVASKRVALIVAKNSLPNSDK